MFPVSTLSGNAMKTVGYKADGECNDYILKAFDIPSVSPELGNDNIFSSDFFLPYDFVSRDVLRDNHPWIKHTIEKLGGELTVRTNSASVSKNGDKYSFAVKVRNTGLQDWPLFDEGIEMTAGEEGKHVNVKLPNLKARESE